MWVESSSRRSGGGGDDGDGIGRLSVRASASGFAGRASAWFNRESVFEFGDRILVYPLDPADQPTLEGGYVDSPGDAIDVLVGLRAYPIGRSGQLGVRVGLASDVNGQDPARQCAVQLELLTSYEALRRFSGELRHLLDGLIERAHLNGERLA